MPIADFMGTKDHSYFQRFYFDRGGDHPGVEIYHRHPKYLISAGGIHDQGRLGGFSDAEDAWAKPTTLIPEVDGLDYDQLVRIKGAENEEDRVNLCVAPGFACGLNPTFPDGIPAACIIRNGNWTFLDFDAKSPGCDLAYGYFVALYSERCDSSDCRSLAGDDGTFGFFEVTPYRVGLAQFAQDVMSANQSWDFKSDKVNLYHGASGRDYTFMAMRDDPLRWNMVSIAENGATTSYEQDIAGRWPLADGELMRSEKHDGCIIIDNPLVGQRLIFDFTDAKHPRRTRVYLSSGGECACPLSDSCLPPRFE